MRNPKSEQRHRDTGRMSVSLGRTSTEVLLGDADYSDWTEEELIRGQRRSRRGKWEGKPPKVVPLQLLHELNRRRSGDVQRILIDATKPAAEYLAKVASGKATADQGRIHACTVILNRVYGMAPQHVQIQTVAPSPYEQAGVHRAIVIRSAIDVESEEWDNPFEDAPTRALPTPAVPPWELTDDDYDGAPFGTDDDDPEEPEPPTGNPIVKGRPTRTK
jgi:hypothetical protein